MFIEDQYIAFSLGSWNC